MPSNDFTCVQNNPSRMYVLIPVIALLGFMALSLTKNVYAFTCTATSGGGSFDVKVTNKGPFYEGSAIHYKLRSCRKHIIPMSCDDNFTFSATGKGKYILPIESTDLTQSNDGWVWTATGTVKLPDELFMPEKAGVDATTAQYSWRYIGLTCWPPGDPIWSKEKSAPAMITWRPKGLDLSRGYCKKDKKCPATTEQAGGINCWRCDDEYRDQLTMDWTALNHTQVVKPNATNIPDGRYIYVLPFDAGGGVSELRLRRYDRPDPKRPACDQYYANFRFKGNERPGQYLHVRHSQLNGGWSVVFSAGEMRVLNGKVDVVNNESGHYKPKKNMPGRVCRALHTWGLKDYPAHCGDRTDYSAELTEDQCKALAADM